MPDRSIVQVAPPRLWVLAGAVALCVALQPAGAQTENDTRHVKWAPEYNCGVQCVYLYLNRDGRSPVDIEELGKQFTIERNQTSLLDCRHALERYGVTTIPRVFKAPSDLLGLPLPAILSVESPSGTTEGHFVLFIKADEATGQIYYCAPTNYVEEPFEAFAPRWDGVALVLARDDTELQQYAAWERATAGKSTRPWLYGATAMAILACGVFMAPVKKWRENLSTHRIPVPPSG